MKGYITKEQLSDSLKQELSNINSQLDHNSNKINNLSIVNVKDFGAKGDGVSDDTNAIQSAIDYLYEGLSYYDSNKQGGIVYFPRGIYKITTIKIKSFITLEGENRLSSVLSPIAEGNYMIDVDVSDDLRRAIQYRICNIGIIGGAKNIGSLEPNRVNIGAINLEKTMMCSINNVIISNIGGSAINLTDAYDTYIDDVEILFCGNSTNPTICVNEEANAIHISNSRFERTEKVVLGGVVRLPREIYFNNTKFEDVIFEINRVSQLSVSNCTFTGNYDKGCVQVLSTGDKRGVKFNNCNFISPSAHNGLAINIDSGYDVLINSCSFTSLKQCIVSNTPIVISSCSFVDCCVSNMLHLKSKLNSITNNIFNAIFIDENNGYMISSEQTSIIQNNHAIAQNNVKINFASIGENSVVCNNYVPYSSVLTSLVGAGCVIKDNMIIDCDTKVKANGYGGSYLYQDIATLNLSNKKGSVSGCTAFDGSNPMIKLGNNWYNISTVRHSNNTDFSSFGAEVGTMVYHLGLNKPIFKAIDGWVDATGQSVDI